MNYNETSQWAADLGSGYSAIRPLGEGGMGTLYRAHKDSLDVDVVIKRVKQKFKGRMDERAEANILKTLKHKYLPRIYDVIESPSGYVYTIMDMIPGENMQNYVKTHGSVSQKLAYRWACQLCEVIAYLHSQVPPILHCDIKPSNIMITPAGDICVIDFNTSLVFSKGVLAIGATPGYAAPEQYRTARQGIPYDEGPWTDIYALGATIYYLLTGQKPPDIIKRLEGKNTKLCLPKKPRVKRARQWQTFLGHAMEPEIKERIGSIRQVREESKGLLN